MKAEVGPSYGLRRDDAAPIFDKGFEDLARAALDQKAW